MSKIKSLFSKAKGRAKYLVAACVSAVSVCAMSICACAEETEQQTSTISTVITSAGEQLKSEFVILVQTLVPLMVGIGVTALGVYAIVMLFNMAKKIFKKAAS